MKCIQIEFRGDTHAPTYQFVTNLVYGPHWFSFKFKEEGFKEVWKQRHPSSSIHAVREWEE